MEDESLVNVEEFLRDNSFSISHSRRTHDVTSDVNHVLITEDSFCSDAVEKRHLMSTLSSTNDTPRFVLLEDDGLVMEQQEEAEEEEGLSEDSTSEIQECDEEEEEKKKEETDQDEQESLDRSMLFQHSKFSLSSDTPSYIDNWNQETRFTTSPSMVSASSSASSLLLERQSVAKQDLIVLSSVYKTIPQQKEVEHVVSESSSVVLMPSLPPSLHSDASMSVSSERVLDNELNEALGVRRILTETNDVSLPLNRVCEKVLLHKKKAARDPERHAQRSTPLLPSRTQRALFINDGDTRYAVRSIDGSRGQSSTWKQSRNEANVSVNEEADVKNENDDECTRYIAVESERKPKCEDAVVTDGGAWNGVNDLLRKNGLPAVRFRNIGSAVLPDRESLISVIHDFSAQLEHKNAMIEDIVLTSQRNSRVLSRLERELQTVTKKHVETRKILEREKMEMERLKAVQRKESENAELLSEKLRSSCRRLQQQLKASEHRVKAKEIVIEKMQNKLQQQVKKEMSNKMRDQHAFCNLLDRDPQRSKPRDIQTLESIGVYEAQREQMNEEIEYLKSQIAALNSELRDKDNCIARQARSALEKEHPVWEHCSVERYTGRVPGAQDGLSSVASDEGMLEQLEAARREHEVVATKLRHREAAMIKKIVLIEEELRAACETIRKLKDENASLLLEVESCPSVKDYRLSQRRIRQLERQVAEKELALEEAIDLNELRKSLGTKELVKRDRLDHRLHLSRLNTLPHEIALDVVKHVCRVLHLTDITLIAPSLDKICCVVTAVPRMEKFIQDVCRFVFLHSHGNADTADISSCRPELEKVLPTLQQWTKERRKLHALQAFKTSIIKELCKRSVEPGTFGDDEDTIHVEGVSSRPTVSCRAADIISELVALERRVLHHREVYTEAAAEIKRRPHVLINQIVRHFLHVFQVKNVEGVLPKINEIHLQVNEVKNFLHATCNILHLRKDTSLVHCLHAVKERLEAGIAGVTRVHGDNPNDDDSEKKHAYVDNSPNFVVEKHGSQPNPRGGGSQADFVGVRQVRQMSVLIRELKRELGAATMDDILPRTKRLMELLIVSNCKNSPEDDDESE